MATQITKNQRSYSSSFAYLSVIASAKRASAGEALVTAEWTIDLTDSGSSLAQATRYLVLYVDSASGTKYYSDAIRSGAWEAGAVYTNTATFVVPLDVAATSIKIGFGVSDTNTAPGTNTTLVWNGSNKYGDDASIQFGTLDCPLEPIVHIFLPTESAPIMVTVQDGVAIISGDLSAEVVDNQLVVTCDESCVRVVDNVAYIGYAAAGEPHKFLVFIFETANSSAKYMPYIYNGTEWERYSDSSI